MPSDEANKLAERISEVAVDEALNLSQLREWGDSELNTIKYFQERIAQIIEDAMQPQLCQGCGDKILIGSAAPSWDAISPDGHKELTAIVESIQKRAAEGG